MSSAFTGFVLKLIRSAPFVSSERSQRFTPTECNNTEEYGNNLRGFSQNVNTVRILPAKVVYACRYSTDWWIGTDENLLLILFTSFPNSADISCALFGSAVDSEVFRYWSSLDCPLCLGNVWSISVRRMESQVTLFMSGSRHHADGHSECSSFVTCAEQLRMNVSLPRRNLSRFSIPSTDRYHWWRKQQARRSGFDPRLGFVFFLCRHDQTGSSAHPASYLLDTKPSWA